MQSHHNTWLDVLIIHIYCDRARETGA